MISSGQPIIAPGSRMYIGSKTQARSRGWAASMRAFRVRACRLIAYIRESQYQKALVYQRLGRRHSNRGLDVTVLAAVGQSCWCISCRLDRRAWIVHVERHSTSERIVGTRSAASRQPNHSACCLLRVLEHCCHYECALPLRPGRHGPVPVCIYLKTLHSMFSRPSMVASSAIMSSTRFFWAYHLRQSRGFSMDFGSSRAACVPLTMSRKHTKASANKTFDTQRAGGAAGLGAHLVADVHLRPVVQLQVVALVLHHANLAVRSVPKVWCYRGAHRQRVWFRKSLSTCLCAGGHSLKIWSVTCMIWGMSWPRNSHTPLRTATREMRSYRCW